MRITHKRTVDKAAVGAAQKRMDAAKAEAHAAMKDLAAQRQAVGAKAGEGRVGGVHREALFEAIRQEGPEVLSSAAQSWWDDQKRMNPWMCADGHVPGCDSINGHRNRIGKVRERMRGGHWEHWDAKLGDWVPGEITPRKGISTASLRGVTDQKSQRQQTRRSAHSRQR